MRGLLWLCVLVGMVATAHAQSEPCVSKLSIHLIGNYTEGARRIIAAKPRVIKVLDPQSAAGMREAMRDYKARHPKGLVVMRVWERTPGVRYRLQDDPVQSADDFWNRVLRPAVQALSPADRRLVDFLEGPNECENTPCWESVEEARWFGRFWERLAERIAQAGFRPCVGSIPVGNPPGSIAEIRAKLEAFLPALRAAKRWNGAWSYHAYSIEYTRDVGVEYWFSLRYRIFYEYLRERHPDLANLPMILTEAGIDRGGNPNLDGWRARGDAAKFQRWLLWYDTELQKDPYIIGATLFQIGDPSGWWSFDVEPIAQWLADVIANRPRALRNPVLNGDFELGFTHVSGETIANGWTAWDGGLVNPAWPGSAHFWRVTGNPGSAQRTISGQIAGQSFRGGVYQRVPVVPGVPYRLQMDYLSAGTGDPNAGQEFGVGYDPSGGSDPFSRSIVWLVSTSAPTHAWRRVEATVVPTGEWLTLWTRCGIYWPVATTYLDVDNVALRASTTLLGRVALADYGGDYRCQRVQVQIRDSRGRVVWRGQLPLSVDGEFEVVYEANVPAGVYNVAIRGAHWLQRVVTGVSLPEGVVNVTLTNGDIDGDNEVSLLDFGALLQAFGTTPGDTRWNPYADLDGDGEVSLLDFGILLRNFGSVGEE
ncbi:MAG: dockerin type I domain-containing protein [Armatimonadota bacterium]|nr:dockerin type I domain-containing protein [Armatimonadota bacterium]